MANIYALILAGCTVPREHFLKLIDTLNEKQRRDGLGPWHPKNIQNLPNGICFNIHAENDTDRREYTREVEIFMTALQNRPPNTQ